MKRKITGIHLNDRDRKLLETLSQEAGVSMSGYIRLLLRQVEREKRTITIPRKQRKAEYAQ